MTLLRLILRTRTITLFTSLAKCGSSDYQHLRFTMKCKKEKTERVKWYLLFADDVVFSSSPRSLQLNSLLPVFGTVYTGKGSSLHGVDGQQHLWHRMLNRPGSTLERANILLVWHPTSAKEMMTTIAIHEHQHTA